MVSLLCVSTLAIIPWSATPDRWDWLPIAIHSVDEADYSSDPLPFWAPAISLDILRDVILDAQPRAADIESRLATVTAVLAVPVPTITPVKQDAPAFIPTKTPPPYFVHPTFTPTQPPTKTPETSRTTTVIPLTPTSTLRNTQPAFATSTSTPTVEYTRTPTRTSTPTKTATSTSTRTPLPYHTSTPTNEPIVNPTDTPTPTATNTSTQTPTSTLTSTPTNTRTPTPTKTNTPTATYTPTPTCALPLPIDGALPDGFVQAIDPDNGEVDVSITLDMITIYYNQPMKNDGGVGSVQLPLHYRLRNLNTNQNIPILSLSYDPVNWVLTFVFDNTDPDWDYGTPYQIRIRNTVRNECGNPQGGNVITTFTTELTPTQTPTATYTATPTPTNTDTPTPTFTDTPTPTYTDTPTPTDTGTPTPTASFTPTPSCAPPLPIDGVLPDGFVQAVEPDNGEVDVSITLDTITIYYNQPMKNDGGGGSVELPVHYRLRNLSNNHSLPILSVSYDPVNWILIFIFDNTDPDWDYYTPYEIRIQGSVRNNCGNPQGGAVTTNFTTEPLPLAKPDPTLETRLQRSPSPSPYWQPSTTPTYFSTPSGTPTIGLPPVWSSTPVESPTQTPAPKVTMAPPAIATPTATHALRTVLPPTARATRGPRLTPIPTITLSAQIKPTSSGMSHPIKEPQGEIESPTLPTGNPLITVYTSNMPLILPGEHFYIDIPILVWWSCFFDPGCAGEH